MDLTAKADHKAAVNLTVENGTLLPGLKLKGEASADLKTCKLSADYKHQLLTAAASLDPLKGVTSFNGSLSFRAFSAGIWPP